jgi:chromosome segregation ATPase
MEPQSASAIAAPDELDAGSLAGVLESQRARIHEHLEAQRRRLGAIQKELAEQLGRLGQPPAGEPSAELEGAVDAARREAEELRARLALQDAELGGLRQELEGLRQGRQPDGQPGDPALQEEHDNLQRRYQMALDDLKAERAQVAQLESRLAQAGTGNSSVLLAGSDWESQKRRLLASLEADFDDANDEQRRERVSIEQAIERTDAIIAAKNAELQKLQKLLEEQQANVGSMAVGAAAVAEILDKEEVIRQERHNLQALQDEWRDKLRQAEVEISVQRAKLARQQAELEERARQIEAQSREAAIDDTNPARATRGRWLRRLGLKSGDEE